MSIWEIDLENRRVLHRPSGLIVRFIHALDGSGAMQADLVNPEALPATLSQEALTQLKQLPVAAWHAYAEAAEATFEQVNETAR